VKLNKNLYSEYKEYPIRVVQFGQGNFLRAFVDWIIDKMNKEAGFNSSVLVIQPRDKDEVYRLNEQDGLYTVILSGIENGQAKEEKVIINSIANGLNTYKEFDLYLKFAENPDIRFIVSNTTEAGIVYRKDDSIYDRPPESFPGKLTTFLYHRYKTFGGDPTKGLLVLPCELIENNGQTLKEIVLMLSKQWELGEGFESWIVNDNIFYNTLVDRIVPGYPKKAKEIQKQLGYEDEFLVQGEAFYLWVIEGPGKIKDEFPAEKLGLNILFVDDLTLYRDRKVRILNGAHTSMVPVAYLYGLNTVREAIEDKTVGNFIKDLIYEEIIPSLDLKKEELIEFADSTIERFKNPYIEHKLLSISLNSMSKYKTRVLPSILEYRKRKGKLPRRLVFSLAALIFFYRGNRGDEGIDLSDEPNILELYNKLWTKYEESQENLGDIVEKILGLESLWEMNLNEVEGLAEQVLFYLKDIVEKGLKNSLEGLIV